MLKPRALVLIAVGSIAGSVASAASYNFDVLYSGGGVAALQPGSDNPVGVNLAPGDTFFWNIQAEGAEFWRVDTGGDFFPLMAFQALPNGNRDGAFVFTLRLDGVQVFNHAEDPVFNSFAHIGTNDITLATGLEFDQMSLSYTLYSASVPDNVLQGLLPYYGAPEQSPIDPGIVYIQGGVVPEPASLALLGLGLAGLGVARRRRA